MLVYFQYQEFCAFPFKILVRLFFILNCSYRVHKHLFFEYEKIIRVHFTKLRNVKLHKVENECLS